MVATQAVLGPAGVPPAELARPIVAAALYPTLLAVFCMGVAMVLRDQAGALGLLFPFLFLVPPLLELVPGLQRLAVLTLWAAAAVLGGWWVLRGRDA